MLQFEHRLTRAVLRAPGNQNHQELTKGAHLDLSGRSAQLCIEGTRAEFERRLDDARGLFRQAWQAAVDDYDRAIAAHYCGHLETDLELALEWHRLALECGEQDSRAEAFMGSLLVCLGGALEALGRMDEAQPYFARAAAHGIDHHATSADSMGE